MSRIPSRLMRAARRVRDDRGIGIVEVIVALMVFSIVAVGMAYATATMVKVTIASTARETATQLAAGEIDRIQSLSDAFQVHDSTTTTEVDDVEYTVTTRVRWVSTTGSTETCGSGGGNLQFKRVNVTVTWPSMLKDQQVRLDSALAPDSRINDPSYGTVLVSVIGVDGTGRSGVTARITPESGGGGQALAEAVQPTDVDGCSYALKVAPGTYRVEVEKANYVDVNQLSVPAYTQLVVAAGATTTASFQYDAATTFTMRYAANAPGTPVLPSNLETTLVGGIADVLKTGTASSYNLHPYVSGYQALAGDSTVIGGSGCRNVDPQAWPETSALKAGSRYSAVSAAPGGAAVLPVAMGVVTVKMPASGTIQAVQQSSGSGGNPGCASTTTYTFSATYSSGQNVTIALPFGAWALSRKSGSTTTAITDVTFVTSGSKSGSTIVLDPRAAKS